MNLFSIGLKDDKETEFGGVLIFRKNKYGELWLHIRAVGEWTNRLLKYFINEERLSSQVMASINPSFSAEDDNLSHKSTNICDINQISDSQKTDRKLSKTSFRIDDELAHHSNKRMSISLAKSEKKLGPFRKFSAPLFVSRQSIDYPIESRRGSEASVIERNPRFRRPSILILPIPENCKNIEENDELESCHTSRASIASNLHIFKSLETGNAIQLVRPLNVHVDGPYGSPSSHIFQTQHAVMIATGIGVTPFASILQSIMQKHINSKQKCPKCRHSWSKPIPVSVMKLRKVDFVWINRDQKSFEWFVNLLSELEIQQAELGESDRFLDIHMYITSALDKSDIKAIGLQLALDLMHEKERRDLITSLKTRTHCGRPNWDDFFRDISQQRRGKVTVFFCGPSEMGKSLHQRCNQFGFKFCKEIF